MPDFERLTDSLRIHAAKNGYKKEWARGYSAGKTRARVEVIAIVLISFVAIMAYVSIAYT